MSAASVRSSRRVFALALLTVGVVACGKSSEPGEVAPATEVDRSTPVPLSINNSHWLDVTIFVFHDGEMSRVGDVTAATSGTFTLPVWMLGHSRTIRLLADPIGSDQWIRSETIYVQPGQSVEWRLESQLQRSTVMVY
jgi:hypothetical protein